MKIKGTREGSGGQELPYMVVFVRAIAGNNAHVQSRFGTRMIIPLNIKRAKSSNPQVGEAWYIDKQFGLWTFAALFGSHHGPEPSDSFNFNHAFMFGS